MAHIIIVIIRWGWLCTGQLQGPAAGGNIRNVPMCISLATAQTPSAAFEADSLAGLIRVPLDSDAHGIFYYLQVP